MKRGNAEIEWGHSHAVGLSVAQPLCLNRSALLCPFRYDSHTLAAEPEPAGAIAASRTAADKVTALNPKPTLTGPLGFTQPCRSLFCRSGQSAQRVGLRLLLPPLRFICRHIRRRSAVQLQHAARSLDEEAAAHNRAVSAADSQDSGDSAAPLIRAEQAATPSS